MMMKRVLLSTYLSLLVLAACTQASDSQGDVQPAIESEMSAAEAAEEEITAGDEDAVDEPASDIVYEGNEADIETIAFDPDSPLQNLINKSIDNLTVEDLHLLLSTPVNVIQVQLDLEPLDIPPEGTEEYVDFFMYGGNVQALPVTGAAIRWNEDKPDLPPRSIDIISDNNVLLGVPLGGTYSDLMEEWGETDRRLFRNARGYAGNYWQAADYHRDGLSISFRCIEPIFADSYIDDYVTEDMPRRDVPNPPWGSDEDAPWDTFPQTVVRAVVCLEGEWYYQEALTIYGVLGLTLG